MHINSGSIRASAIRSDAFLEKRFGPDLRQGVPFVVHVLFRHDLEMTPVSFERLNALLHGQSHQGKNLLLLREIFGSDDGSDQILNDLLDQSDGAVQYRNELMLQEHMANQRYGEGVDEAAHAKATMRLFELEGLQSLKAKHMLGRVKVQNIDLTSADTAYHRIRTECKAEGALYSFLGTSGEPSHIKESLYKLTESHIREQAMGMKMRDDRMKEQVEEALKCLDQNWIVVILTGSEHFQVTTNLSVPVMRLYSTLTDPFLKGVPALVRRQHTTSLAHMKEHLVRSRGVLAPADLRDACLELLLEQCPAISLETKTCSIRVRQSDLLQGWSHMLSRILLHFSDQKREQLFEAICEGARTVSVRASAEDVLMKVLWPDGRAPEKSDPLDTLNKLFALAYRGRRRTDA